MDFAKFLSKYIVPSRSKPRYRVVVDTVFLVAKHWQNNVKGSI